MYVCVCVCVCVCVYVCVCVCVSVLPSTIHRNDLSSQTLDLHGLHVEEAISALQEKLHSTTGIDRIGACDNTIVHV